MSWFTEMFIKQVKPALDFYSGVGSGSSSDDGTQMYILLDEEGNEYPAVVVEEETVFDATANDIREGKVAATEDGVTVGTKEIPACITTEGTKVIRAGQPVVVDPGNGKHEYTKLLAVICAFNTSPSDSVAVEKSCINDSIYLVNSTEVLSTVTVDNDAENINLGITNDGNKPVIIRYITYKEEY